MPDGGVGYLCHVDIGKRLLYYPHKDTVGWGFGIGFWRAGVYWDRCKGSRVGTTRIGDVEAGEAGRWVGAGGAGP